MNTITITIDSDIPGIETAIRNALHGLCEDVGSSSDTGETIVTALTDDGDTIWDTTTVNP